VGPTHQAATSRDRPNRREDSDRCLDTSGLTDGAITYLATATDSVGNTSTNSLTVANDGTWSVVIDTSALAAGAITFTVTATDSAGNTTTSSLGATRGQCCPQFVLKSADEAL
jgi:hypothetical protein